MFVNGQWVETRTFLERVISHYQYKWDVISSRVAYFTTNWLLSTNHKRISIMYFYFLIVTSFSGLLLATIIRIELAYPGRMFLSNNAEKYLTVISLHGIVMVFFVVIPALFGAFGNFLLPTQLGVRDVAFPRLNSFMFWITPSGFILISHIFFFDKGTKVFLSNSNTESYSWFSLTNINNNFLGYFSFLVTYFDVRWFWRFERYSSKIVRDYKKLNNKTRLDALNSKKLGQDIYGVDLSFDFVKYYMSSLVNTLARKADYFMYFSGDMVSVYIDSLREAEFSNTIKIKVSSHVSNQLIPGWAFITPYSSNVKFSAVGKVDIALLVVLAASLGSIFSALNYVITYRCLGSKSSKNRREVRSFFVDSLLVASRMMLAANPALIIAIMFLLSDRHAGTSMFDFSGGGDTILFQHLFWFFGHPEVYIIIIPCFGFVNSILPLLLNKRLSGRLSLQFSMYTIAFMGFAVWGHHMYMVGLSNTARTLYSTMTVMISVPASTKVLHWCVTIMNSSPKLNVSLLFLLSFNYFFVLGGLSGMFVAHIGFDIIFHDTFYVIGHFHVMLAGAAVSCIFAAFYFYYHAIFGVNYFPFLAYLHFFFYFFGQIFTVSPMFWLGYSGMPRRVMDYPAHFGGWHSIISGGHFLSVMGYFFFVLNIFLSLLLKDSSTINSNKVSRFNTRFGFYLYTHSVLSEKKKKG